MFDTLLIETSLLLCSESRAKRSSGHVVLCIDGRLSRASRGSVCVWGGGGIIGHPECPPGGGGGEELEYSANRAGTF